jgi:hypothetical protein
MVVCVCVCIYINENAKLSKKKSDDDRIIISCLMVLSIHYPSTTYHILQYLQHWATALRIISVIFQYFVRLDMKVCIKKCRKKRICTFQAINLTDKRAGCTEFQKGTKQILNAASLPENWTFSILRHLTSKRCRFFLCFNYVFTCVFR